MCVNRTIVPATAKSIWRPHHEHIDFKPAAGAVSARGWRWARVGASLIRDVRYEQDADTRGDCHELRVDQSALLAMDPGARWQRRQPALGAGGSSPWRDDPPRVDASFDQCRRQDLSADQSVERR